jgi:UPF0755 protein
MLAAAGIGTVFTLVIPAGEGHPQSVTVEAGETVSEVAEMLRGMGLIRNERAFIAAAYVTRKWQRVQAGRHNLDGGMNALEILDALCQPGENDWRWITIPEGFTLAETAARIEEEQLGSVDEFVREALQPEAFDVAFPLPADSLEGYLFPDTYRVDAGQTERDVIVQMLHRFEEVVWDEIFGGRKRDGELDLKQTLVLASMVEEEAKRDEERSTIAGVYMNRLRRGQLLECDATVQYALGADRKTRLTYDDLEVDSDYNTYLHPGLPPGPICSPGEASIRAAASPADVPYLYYVAKPDGSHVFSRTLREHQAATARLRRQR